MSEPVGNFYKNVFEPNRDYARKPDRKRRRRTLPRTAVGSFLEARGIGGGGHDVKVGDSKPGMGVTGELTPCALLSMVSSEKRRFQRCVNLDPQNDEQDRLGAKVSLSLERPRAWDVTPHQDLPAQAFVIGSPREVTFHRGPCSSTL